jgi:S-adenosylmethionine-diacylglycerol 3-amino-3-carboxypropyl transferase
MNGFPPQERSAIAGVPTIRDRIDQRIFDSLYRRSLVYNTCWEDPAVDRLAMRLGPADRVMVITSAGCNALDYALQAPTRIDAVDANPRQNALLELKIAGIRALDFGTFFSLFGDGFNAEARTIYRTRLRHLLSAPAQAFWDRHIGWFCSRQGSFYFHGLAGFVARGFRMYFRMRPQLAADITELLNAHSIDAQRAIYDQKIAAELWTPTINWVLNRQLTMSLLGVPHPQRRLIQKQHAGGVAGYIRDAIEYVFRDLPVGDNYFWRVYLTGRYTRDCCPAYLTERGFSALRDGLVDRIHIHTGTVTDVLSAGGSPITHFVLLDHMDWMSDHAPAALAEEWDAIVERAAPRAQVLIRSAHAAPPFLDWLRIGPGQRAFDDLFDRDDDLAACLHQLDRVHTYAGFVIACIKTRHGGR